MRAIGFTGKPESGKSTAADHIAEKYGLARINVGDPIKAMLAGLYKWSGLSDSDIYRRLYGDLKEKPDPYLNGKTPRYAMQTIGKEWRDLISPTLFVDRWKEVAVASGGVAADGMRYADEVGPLRELGGVIVHVIRPGTESAGGTHVAETLQIKPDVTIVNAGSLERFKADLDYVLGELLDRRAA